MSGPGVAESDGDGENAETWRALVDLFLAQRDRFLGAAAACGLTPVHAHALRTLIEQGPDAPPMRGLAQVLECDASNVTAIVDRLEARGFVERRPSSTDRRVKTLVVTTAGREAAGRIAAVLYQAPDGMRSLSAADRQALRRIVRRLVDPSHVQ